MATFVKLESAPANFQVDTEHGQEFDAEFADKQIAALRAAGWAVPKNEAKKK